MAARKDNGVAEMQERYITARKMNMWPTDAARWAGYKDPIKAAKRLESENVDVMEAVQEIEKQNSIMLKNLRRI